jgi:O-acetyl-ADP-ribose deacetylase (regulator of RNase III)
VETEVIERKGDLWRIGRTASAIVVTTNGTVKRNGENVMGGGCAWEAAQRWPMLPACLGKRILRKGNHVHVFFFDSRQQLVTMPTKDDVRQPSNLILIMQSVKELHEYAEDYQWKKVVMPRPGCGLGGLDWEEVKPIVSYLDNRFIVVSPA